MTRFLAAGAAVAFALVAGCNGEAGLDCSRVLAAPPGRILATDSPNYVCFRQTEYHPMCTPVHAERLGDSLGNSRREEQWEEPRATRAILGIEPKEAVAVEMPDQVCSGTGSRDTEWLLTIRAWAVDQDRTEELIKIAQSKP